MSSAFRPIPHGLCKTTSKITPEKGKKIKIVYNEPSGNARIQEMTNKNLNNIGQGNTGKFS